MEVNQNSLDYNVEDIKIAHLVKRKFNLNLFFILQNSSSL